ncbi:MAG: zf-HC2 domain-containing protein [Candidatus Marinimicrobia bacterium]|nr:zf-HC2 domain-containing protein [Candidatus Neomarinimicrobiota bacterium]
MKSCKDYEDLLPLYTSGDLSSTDHNKVSEHLKECKECRDYQLSLSAITAVMKRDSVEMTPGYGAELVVALNGRLDRRSTWQKRLLWTIPAFATAMAVVVITIISLIETEPAGNQWVAELNRERDYLNFTDTGYFGEIPVDDSDISNGDIDLSTDDLYRDAVYQIVENPQISEVDSYLLATANLDNEDFEKVIEQLKYEIL